MVLEITVPPDTGQFRRLRDVLRAWIDDPLDASLVQLIATELLANAFEASPPDEPVRLRLAHRDSHLSITVADRGPGIGQRSVDLVPAHHSRGRGLYIVSQLADLRIVSPAEPTVIEADLRLGAHARSGVGTHCPPPLEVHDGPLP